MAEKSSEISKRYSNIEGEGYRELVRALRFSGIPDDTILAQLSLFQPRVAIGQTLFLDEVYRQVLDVPGSIAEFGVYWGRNLALFHSLRNLYEPHNMSRHILGFDTFEGFPSVSDRDGSDTETRIGGLSVSSGWESALADILRAHQKLSMRPETDRFRLIKGDVSLTVPVFLEENPHSLFALIYLDMDLYKPTVDVLNQIWSRVPKGGIVVFDEINLDLFPGETEALLECIDIGAHQIRRSRHALYQAYVIK